MKEKDTAIRSQDFEAAGGLRDREVELRAQIKQIQERKQEENKAKTEAGDDTGPCVQEQDIADIVASWTGIPVDKVSSDEGVRLMDMEATLHKRLIGQEEAVVACARAIRRARTGFEEPEPSGRVLHLLRSDRCR